MCATKACSSPFFLLYEHIEELDARLLADEHKIKIKKEIAFYKHNTLALAKRRELKLRTKNTAAETEAFQAFLKKRKRMIAEVNMLCNAVVGYLLPCMEQPKSNGV